MYSKEVHLNHDHNAENKKGIGVQTTEETSKNYSNICNNIAQFRKFWVGFGSFLGRLNFDSIFVCCVVIVVQMCSFCVQTSLLFG